MVLSSLAMLSIMMVEFTFNTQINLQISNNFKNSLKAQELAKSGIHFSMLELTIYKNIRENPALKQIPGFNEGMLDMIWQFGFLYPPPLSKKGTFGQERQAKELVETSLIDGKIRVEIQDEGTKINLNDLVNPQLRPGIVAQLDTIFERKKTTDEDFNQKYKDLRTEELSNQILDWIDKDNIKTGGGDEDNYYSRQTPPYKSKNAPLDVVSELALIEGFNQKEIFDLLLPYVTVYSIGGINVNTADAAMLMTISPEITEEDAKKIVQHRNTAGYFKDTKAFEDFCKNTLLKSSEFNKNPKISLNTRSTIYSLKSRAEVKGVVQTITAVVDISKAGAGAPEILYWNIN